MEVVDAPDWRRPALGDHAAIRRRTGELIAEIEAEGDPAIERHSLRFDGFAPTPIPLKPWQSYPLDKALKRHLAIAANRIERFCKLQRKMYRDASLRDRYGTFGHRIIPLESMAAYIPGGRFPLISTALMTLIPAGVAGVPHRLALSPSDHPALLASASLAGATHFLRLGGAQAIAAAALGSAWNASVDMVVGPGNAYVNAAKALLQDRVKIDTLAGPSELLMLCDRTMDPHWAALDILAQAEHDSLALSVIASLDRPWLERVLALIAREIDRYPDKETGLVQAVLCAGTNDMIALANKMAPEHLHLACDSQFLDQGQLKNYGSLFVGPFSAVALGDYCSGPNHTLPTLGFARLKGGLQVGDFFKVATFQDVDARGYADLAGTAMALAQAEGLAFHRQSLAARCRSED